MAETYDLACPADAGGSFDLDPDGRLLYGVDALSQNLTHKLVTPAGGLLDDAAWGDDLRLDINDYNASPEMIGARVKAQWLADDRVLDCDVTVTVDPDEGTIEVSGEGECDEGAFTVDYTVTAFPSAAP